MECSFLSATSASSVVKNNYNSLVSDNFENEPQRTQRAQRGNDMDLLKDDSRYVWHPYTQAQTSPPALPIVRGEGIYLYRQDGTRLIDGISSWWVNLHGHAHPSIAKAITDQAQLLEHVQFGGCTHPPAVNLAQLLLEILPGELGRIFYSDNGSTSVEVALKIALQYWINLDHSTPRRTILCFDQGYHGDTFGAMSVSARSLFTRPFWTHLFNVRMIPTPTLGLKNETLQLLREQLAEGDVAAFIFEPLILGASGMLLYDLEGLNACLQLCRAHGVLLIADEAMTGFGRTETLFASEQLDVLPDIICLSKGITGGFLTLGVTACQEYLYEAFLASTLEKSLLHGHSYTGNPLACAAALASLDLLLGEHCHQQRQMIIRSHQSFCAKWKHDRRVMRCESMGTILIVEYRSDTPSGYTHSLRDVLRDFFLKKGILLRPLGNVVYLMPPYCITAEELRTVYQAFIESTEVV